MSNIPNPAVLENTRSVSIGMTRLFIPARNDEAPQPRQAISAKLTAST
jgi:hypothetical protein